MKADVRLDWARNLICASLMASLVSLDINEKEEIFDKLMATIEEVHGGRENGAVRVNALLIMALEALLATSYIECRRLDSSISCVHHLESALTCIVSKAARFLDDLIIPSIEAKAGTPKPLGDRALKIYEEVWMEISRKMEEMLKKEVEEKGKSEIYS